MSETGRPRGFVFDVRDYLTSTAVRAMGTLGRGAYAGLMPSLWEQPEPGVVEDDDLLLASLALATPEEWALVRERVSRAFDLTSRPGYWIQRRMVEEYAASCRRYAQQQVAGTIAAKASVDKRLSTTRSATDQRIVNAPLAPRQRAVNAASTEGEGEGEESKSKEEAEAARAREAPAPARPVPAPAATKSRRLRKPPNLEISAEAIARCAERFKLDPAVVEHLAERIRLEAAQRGYLNAESALLTWCRREAANPAPHANGGAQDAPQASSGAHPKHPGYPADHRYLGDPEDRPTPGWNPPGLLSWQNGILGLELPGPNRWRPLHGGELAEWQYHVEAAAGTLETPADAISTDAELRELWGVDDEPPVMEPSPEP